MTSKQVHKELSMAKEQASETYQEYTYRMLELASHADMELKSKIMYIVDGIQDDGHKTMLYGQSRSYVRNSRSTKPYVLAPKINLDNRPRRKRRINRAHKARMQNDATIMATRATSVMIVHRKVKVKNALSVKHSDT